MKHFENNANIEELIKTSLDKVKTLMETKTIIGDEVVLKNGTTIIPISKVSVGYVVGGGEYSDKSSRRVANRFPMAGGNGCGMSVSPVGFLAVDNDGVKFVDIENKSMYQTILNLINKIISKSAGDDKNEEND